LLRPDISLRETPPTLLSTLCAHLDGLPLALEMAAARLATLSTGTVLQKLTESLEVLVSAHTDVHPRHLSLEATFRWSYQLLSPEAQWLLRTLSAFRGGCSQEAAEAISGRPALLASLTELVDASLVLRESQGESVRYRLLESIRQFADSLREPAEREPLSQRHALYFSQSDSKEESENRVLALHWLQQTQSDLTAELQLAEALFLFWTRQGTLQFNLATVERTLARLLQLESIPSQYNQFLIEVTLHYARTSNFTQAFALIDTIDQKCDYNYLFVESKARAFAFMGNIEKALNYYKELLKDESISPFHYILSCINMSSLYTRIARHQEAFDLLKMVQEKNNLEVKNQRFTAIILCSLSLVQGRLQQSREGLVNFREAARIFEQLGDHHSLMRIGWYEAELLRRIGEWEEAFPLYQKSVLDCHALSETDLLTEGLLGVVHCHQHFGNSLRALVLLGGIQALITTTGCLRTSAEQQAIDQLAEQVYRAYGGDAREAFTMGQTLKPDPLVALAQETV
jgi:tetratricopeptide (TPR) repeat protein